jgi:hypothetical protein
MSSQLGNSLWYLLPFQCLIFPTLPAQTIRIPQTVTLQRQNKLGPETLDLYLWQTNPSSYSESAVESILGLQTDGPFAQDIKIKNVNLVMRFNTAADRDEANNRINAHQSN